VRVCVLCIYECVNMCVMCVCICVCEYVIICECVVRISDYVSVCIRVCGVGGGWPYVHTPVWEQGRYIHSSDHTVSALPTWTLGSHVEVFKKNMP
jgi:hypothetical protein